MIYDLYLSGRKFASVTILLFVLVLQSSLFAQTGSMIGHVYDKQTKSTLVGANIIIKGTSLGAASDLNGKYVIRNIPAGRHLIIVSYIGYVSDSEAVNVPANKTLQQNFYLNPQAVLGKTVTITAQAQGQVSAIQQQLTSNKISNIVSSAKIQQLPDFNAAQALSRLPGISTLQSSGEADKIVIRGLAPQYNQIAISGVRLASTGSDQIGAASQNSFVATGSISNNRSVNIAGITSYMIKSIEVYKEPTPDLDADELGGYVNMQLREAPKGIHADVLWQSGYTQKSNKYGNYKFVGSGSDRFFNNLLGIYALVNAESYDRNADNMNASYTVTNSQNIGSNGYLPVEVTNVNLDRHIETRDRYGANLILDYNLPSGSLKMVNIFSREKSQFQDYRTGYNYQNGDLNFTYTKGINTVDVGESSLHFNNDFGFMTADIIAAENYSRNNLPSSPEFDFAQTRGVDKSPNNVPPESLTYLVRYSGPSNTYLNNISLFSSDYKESDQTYKGDFKFPFNTGFNLSGFFKFGGEYRYDLIDNSQNTPFAGMQGGSPIANEMLTGVINRFPQLKYDSAAAKFSASNFTSSDNSLYNNFLGDKFGRMLWIENPGILTNVMNYISSDPAFNAIHSSGVNPGGWTDGPFQTQANTYTYIERYYAAYLMAQLNYGNLMVVGGARYEQQKSLFHAFNIKDGRNPSTDRAYPVTVYPQNHFWLPMIQAKYDITPWLNVRYAFAQTLARPAYSELSPHFNISYSGDQVSSGNPDLVPAHAYNHDLIFTVHSNDIGLLSVDGFYKEIKNFTFATQYTLYSTAPPGLKTYRDFNVGGKYPNLKATLNTFLNTPYLALVKGLELDFQTRFWYLPGFLSGIVFGINYTKIHSQATYPLRFNRSTLVKGSSGRGTIVTEVVDSSRAGRLIDQPNDILNCNIGYDYKGFSARLSFLFQGNSVSYIGAYPEQDGFTRNYFRMDFFARQELPWKGLEIYTDIYNLNNEKNTSAQISIGGFTNEQNYGLTADLGVRYRL